MWYYGWALWLVLAPAPVFSLSALRPVLSFPFSSPCLIIIAIQFISDRRPPTSGQRNCYLGWYSVGISASCARHRITPCRDNNKTASWFRPRPRFYPRKAQSPFPRLRSTVSSYNQLAARPSARQTVFDFDLAFSTCETPHPTEVQFTSPAACYPAEPWEKVSHCFEITVRTHQAVECVFPNSRLVAPMICSPSFFSLLQPSAAPLSLKNFSCLQRWHFLVLCTSFPLLAFLSFSSVGKMDFSNPNAIRQALEHYNQRIAALENQLATSTASVSRPRPLLPDPDKFGGKSYDTWLPLIQAKLDIDGEALGGTEKAHFCLCLRPAPTSSDKLA